MKWVCNRRRLNLISLFSMTAIVWGASVAFAVQDQYDIDLKELRRPPVSRVKETAKATRSRQKTEQTPQSTSAPLTPQPLDTVHEREVSVPPARPCLLAREVADQLGVRVSSLSPLLNEESVSVSYDVLKIAVVCGFTHAERYTLERLLARRGIKLLAFKSDESPRAVIEGLAGRLGITLHLSKAGPSSELPLTYLFPGSIAGSDLLLTIRPEVPASK